MMMSLLISEFLAAAMQAIFKSGSEKIEIKVKISGDIIVSLYHQLCHNYVMYIIYIYIIYIYHVYSHTEY